jgi:hypothetical protein
VKASPYQQILIIALDAEFVVEGTLRIVDKLVYNSIAILIVNKSKKTSCLTTYKPGKENYD